MKIILCGYHWTGCEALRLLQAAGHDVFVFTHEGPYHIPSLLNYCQSTGTPYSLENVNRVPLPFKPDCIASIYYRFIIKPHVIEACQGKIFNLHPSLLPKYRGCSSLTWALIEGEQQAGFTYHYIDEGCDTGKILVQKPVEIRAFDTQESLYLRVATQAMQDFDDALEMVLSGAAGRAQAGEPSYFSRGCPHDGQIDPAWSDAQIERFIRAMIYPPYPPAQFAGRAIHTLGEYHAEAGAALVTESLR